MPSFKKGSLNDQFQMGKTEQATSADWLRQRLSSTLAMTQDKGHNSSTMDIRKAIRCEFAFLIDVYGYSEVPPTPPSDEAYAEIHFEKNKWKIAILTTAHGSRLAIQLVSPKNQRISLSYLFDSESANSIRPKSDSGLFADINYNALCLQKYGSEILNGDEHDYERLFDEMTVKHKKWLVESGILSEKDLSHFKWDLDK